MNVAQLHALEIELAAKEKAYQARILLGGGRAS